MNLKAKQGRNQKGLCFVSTDEGTFNEGLYRISFHGNSMFADLRASSSVPQDMIVIDQRIFSRISCKENSEVHLEKIAVSLPTCSEIRLSLTSTRDLDNRKIADAISKRVNDLHDDFDGLILQVGQSIQIDRLGIKFTVISLHPVDSDHHAARIVWMKLEKIHLDPVESLAPINLVCIVEVGAAAQISDVKKEQGKMIPRYEIFLEAIKLLSEIYSDFDSNSQFCGVAYSDEIIPFTVFDPNTGKPTEISSIHSSSHFIAFNDWIKTMISDNKGKASNPSEALKYGIESTDNLLKSKNLQTIVLFFSSGVHTSGPNPVKTAKKLIGNKLLKFLCVVPGEKANHDVMIAIAENYQGRVLSVIDFDEISRFIDILVDLSGGH
ncbi:hypothetical protein E4H12_02185 [Candidatus Thorarchaeota archaeon]|nr:MAG: hypothetical protein E4H12_02185 [Candidatus Thorarchaeota archaeon]